MDTEPQEMSLIDRVKSYACSAAVLRAPWLELLMADVIHALAAQEWQDISTAPKDGHGILICGGTVEYTGGTFTTPVPFKDVEIVRWDGSLWEGPYGSEYDERYLFQPTHWQPLPKPRAAVIAEERTK